MRIRTPHGCSISGGIVLGLVLGGGLELLMAPQSGGGRGAGSCGVRRDGWTGRKCWGDWKGDVRSALGATRRRFSF